MNQSYESVKSIKKAVIQDEVKLLDLTRFGGYLISSQKGTTPPTHPPYSPEFELKHQMVELVRAGRSPAENWPESLSQPQGGITLLALILT